MHWPNIDFFLALNYFTLNLVLANKILGILSIIPSTICYAKFMQHLIRHRCKHLNCISIHHPWYSEAVIFKYVINLKGAK